ncbi:MAG: hypothetical protein JF615_14405, partial [Asticcacaulis sp.]|nr:hypothetical protein [Asticcacaulis sp.]
FTHSYTAKGKPAQEDMDITRIVKILTDNYQGVNDVHVEMAVEGNATIECYIDSHHDIDACVIREFPMAYGFGPTFEAFFSGRVAVSEQDGDGVPTARKRVALTVRWVLDGGH